MKNMTEAEYYKILKKEKIFYTLIVMIWIFALMAKIVVSVDHKYFILLITFTIIYLYLKDIFTGLKWSERLVKPQPKAGKKAQSSTSYICNEAYEQSIEGHYPFISTQEKNGYLALLEICHIGDQKNALFSFFQQLKDYSFDDDYMTTLNYVMEHLDRHHIFFLMALDHKSDIATLQWRVEKALKHNFAITIKLPDIDQYAASMSISSGHVLQDHNQALESKGFRIGFIDTESDEYVIFIYKIENQEKVEPAVNDLGYQYFRL